MKKAFVGMGAALLLSGCSTGAGFSKALENQVKFAQAARNVVPQANAAAIKARVVGLTGSRPDAKDLVATLGADLCSDAEGIFNTDTSLAAFGDSLEVIKDVAAKPDDVSYAGYVAQFRKNSEYVDAAVALSDPATRDAARQKALIVEKRAQVRCKAMFEADLAATLEPAPNSLVTTESHSLGTLLAFDVMIKTALAAVESVQRDEAVRRTAKALIPGLTSAHQKLASTDLSTFVPRVVYSSAPLKTTDGNPAAAMSRTTLGATITLRRWYLAQEIKALTGALARCDASCLGNPAQRHNLDELIVAMRDYRALSAVDTDKALVSIGKGVADAKSVADGSTSIAGMLDGLLAIADTLSGLDKSYQGYRDSRN